MKIKISFSFWLASLLLSVGQHYPLKVPDPPEVKAHLKAHFQLVEPENFTL